MQFKDILAQKFKQFQPTKEEITQQQLTRGLYLYRKEFQLSFEELCDEPIPSFIIFNQEIIKENKRQEQEMNKGRRR